jgi:branched-chain amino acid transport system permease protein
MEYFLETLIGGLLAGVMYALVAIGFVLIYKASGVFNFAQGSMVLLAALTFVSIREQGVAFWLALLITLAVMIVVAIVIERTVLRPLVGRSPMTIFMATLGLSFVVEGLAQAVMGASAHELDLGIEDIPYELDGILISQFDLVASAIAGGFIVGAGEALAETYLSPELGGGISSWFAYVLALLFLLARPAGLFGERTIERV